MTSEKVERESEERGTEGGDQSGTSAQVCGATRERRKGNGEREEGGGR